MRPCGVPLRHKVRCACAHNCPCIYEPQHRRVLRQAVCVCRIFFYPACESVVFFNRSNKFCCSQSQHRRSILLGTCMPKLLAVICRYTHPNGSTVLVNHSPHLGLASFSFNAYSPPDLAFTTFSIASYLVSEQVQVQQLLDPTTG